MKAPGHRPIGERPSGSADAEVKSCPICAKPVRDAAAAPFCSKRCADVDLHRWLGGVYAVPVDEVGHTDVGDEE